MVEEKVTGFPGVPTIFATLAELKIARASYDLLGDPLRHQHRGGAAGQAHHACCASCSRRRASSRCTASPSASAARTCRPRTSTASPTSVGIAIPNTELWLVDEDGNKLGPDQVGQLVIRGATVMKGYWEKPEATAKKLRPGPLPGETGAATPATSAGSTTRATSTSSAAWTTSSSRAARRSRRRRSRARSIEHRGRAGGGGHRRPRRPARAGREGVRRARARA